MKQAFPDLPPLLTTPALHAAFTFAFSVDKLRQPDQIALTVVRVSVGLSGKILIMPLLSFEAQESQDPSVLGLAVQ